MTPVYVSKEEYKEANFIENSAIGYLKIMIFKFIFNKADASIQQEIYNKLGKEKKKRKICLFSLRGK